jgi:uncharacterized protein (TIGR02588 family)
VSRNWLEWVVLAASAAVLAGIVGFLIVDGLSGQGRPPEPVVTLDPAAAYEAENGWLVPAVVRNVGDTAAEAAVLRATAQVSGETEESEITIDYLPAASHVDVTFGFSAKPEGEVRVAVIGFRLP